MLKRILGFGLVVIVFVGVVGGASGYVPQLIKFSGRYMDADRNPIEGTRYIRFSFVDENDVSLHSWEETHQKSLANGIFDVTLGTVYGAGIPASIFDNDNVFLKVQIGAIDGSWDLEGNQEIVSVPYAFRALRAAVADSGGGWTDDGTDTTTTRNVGIGTASPGYKLDTHGVIRSLANDEPPPEPPASGKGLEMYYYMNFGNDLHDAGYLTSIDRGGVGADRFKPLRLYGDVISLVNAKGGVDAGEHGVAFMSRHLSSQGRGLYMGYVADGSEVTGAFIRQGGTGAAGIGTLDLGTIGAKQAIRIAYDGKVGIGDASPDAKLDVINIGSGASLRVDDKDNDSTPFIIDADGDVGIGTTNPGKKLEVMGTAHLHGASGIDGLSVDSGGRVGVKDSTPDAILDILNQTAGVTSFRVDDSSDNDSTPFVIDNGGNVGIGTEGPDSKLHVIDQMLIQRESIAAGQTAELLFKVETDTGDIKKKAGVIFEKGASYGRGKLHLANDIVADDNNVDKSDAKLTIDWVTGNVGIGTTDPEEKLTVDGVIETTTGVKFPYGRIQEAAGPIAYAFIKSDGTKSSGTANVTSSWNAADSRYEIDIDGKNYFWTNFVTIVTPTSNLIARNGSAGGKLLVYLYDPSTGQDTQGNFQFVTYQP